MLSVTGESDDSNLLRRNFVIVFRIEKIIKAATGDPCLADDLGPGSRRIFVAKGFPDTVVSWIIFFPMVTVDPRVEANKVASFESHLGPR